MAIDQRPSPAEPQRLDPVEKLVLGVSPEDQLTTAPTSSTPAPWARAGDPVQARLGEVRALLAAEPTLHEQVTAEVQAVWRRSEGSRSAYLSALAGRRAELISRAQLHAVSQRGPAAIAEFLDELSAYLTVVEGRRDGGRR
jgi:hypothetical protein